MPQTTQVNDGDLVQVVQWRARSLNPNEVPPTFEVIAVGDSYEDEDGVWVFSYRLPDGTPNTSTPGYAIWNEGRWEDGTF